MLEPTKIIVRTALKADRTITESEQSAWARLLAKGSPVSAASCAPDPLPRLVPIKEVQILTGLTEQAIRGYARKGFLERILPPGGQRARGYTEASVRAFLEGRAAAAVPPCDAGSSGEGTVQSLLGDGGEKIAGAQEGLALRT